jgi:tRNA(Ile)-lysidine synthetase-like protein
MSFLETVRATIAQNQLIETGDTVVVGVSGGADSLALLDVLRQLRAEYRMIVHVAHFNHLLRGANSDADAEFVAQIAREWRMPATIEAGDVALIAEERRMSIEEAARYARYAFLARVAHQVDTRTIAVAHHADDQVETILLHLIRGAGLAGLRGMQYALEISSAKFDVADLESSGEGRELKIIRPLLDASRADIDAHCAKHYLAPRVDHTNSDNTLFRNRVRNEVLPYLEQLNPNLRAVLLRTAQATADDYGFIQHHIRAEYTRVAYENEGAIIFDRALWRALHPAVQRGTLREAIRELRGGLQDFEWAHIENARRIALEKETGAEATLPLKLVLVLGYNEFTLRDVKQKLAGPDVPLLHVERLDLPVAGAVDLPDTHWRVETDIVENVQIMDDWTALLDFEKCQEHVFLRCRRPGDRFQPAGMKGKSQTLNEFMINEKIPSAIRDRLPLLIVGDRIGWVCGYRTDERARATFRTRGVWRVRFVKKDRA